MNFNLTADIHDLAAEDFQGAFDQGIVLEITFT
jgi:hypothetical protein